MLDDRLPVFREELRDALEDLGAATRIFVIPGNPPERAVTLGVLVLLVLFEVVDPDLAPRVAIAV